MKTVLASVSDKSGLVDFLKALQQYDELRIIATGSTAAFLQDNGLACQTVEDITGFPEIMEGRVKTLHPKIFGGILSRDRHQADLDTHQIPQIDFVIVNLYPFQKTAQTPGKSYQDIIENIDIGGVSLIRAAAKNHERVTVIPSPGFYAEVTLELGQAQGTLSAEFRRKMARQAFDLTSHYDSVISAYLFQQEQDQTEQLPNQMTLHLNKLEDLRYGENPQQKAAWYYQSSAGQFTPPFEQLQGKEMSANNILDAFAAFKILQEFPSNPTCCIIKHNNPCGVAIGNTLEEAFEKAYAVDPVSAFGGIFGFNETVNRTIANDLTQHFIEIVMAPEFTADALEILTSKKNVRVLKVPSLAEPKATQTVWTLKDLESFGLLLQESTESRELPQLTTVTKHPLADNVMSDVAFAWSVVKHLTSNAILIVKDGQTIGMGIGQTSRIASTQIALQQAGDRAKGAVLASDGFLPATDNIEAAAEAGIAIIVQPGGSIKDSEVIQAADERGLVMVMTGERCFRH